MKRTIELTDPQIDQLIFLLNRYGNDLRRMTVDRMASDTIRQELELMAQTITLLKAAQRRF